MASLTRCNETILFDLNLNTAVDDPLAHQTFRVCAMADSGNSQDLIQRRGIISRQQLAPNITVSSSSTTTSATTSTLMDNNTSSCGHVHQAQATVDVSWWGVKNHASNTHAANGFASTASQLENYLTRDDTCGKSVLFSKAGDIVMGVYIGSQYTKSGAAQLLSGLHDYQNLLDKYVASQLALEVCGDKSLGPEIIAVFIDTTGNISAVQTALRGWNEAKCLTGFSGQELWTNVSLSMIPPSEISIVPGMKSQTLSRRDTCSYTQAVAGDGCWSLAERCGITQDDLESYNPVSDFCNTIEVGQYVCCSSGSLPDFSPQPNADGSCYTYTIQFGDLCSTIANTYNIPDATKIEAYNSETWGWEGCSYLMIGQNICLSSGDPPMPAAVANAQCGPQVPGTERPTNGTALADLNPCPLNACCDIWGECGITDDFCTADPADTGAPGTAQPNSNGCISNCGTNITNNDATPAEFRRVGYYESFNWDRPCLHMSPSDIDTDIYTHVHYAFATITSDFAVNISEYTDVFDQFVQLTGTKRILSFGGWSFSTDTDTYPIFRSGVSDDERSLFATNVAQFITEYDLDGVDFDWEYPGAPDIPGIPAGSPTDGPNYLSFLKLVRAALPDDKSVSIAAPASYWYLKGFPIKDIGSVVDYIIYMTYDLHGQWDYGNTFANSGCPNGNCLRSHINMTETHYALSMITKAGVPASKIMVGMARYGRSFQMTEAGCWGANCTFTGPESGATPGECTQTAGYISNYEINEILSAADDTDLYSVTVETYVSEGDILVYNSTQWISYMTDDTYETRLAYYQGLNFGGTSDWALDLAEDWETGVASDGDETADATPPCDLSLTFDTLDALAAVATSYDPYCAQIYAVDTLGSELAVAQVNYTTVDTDYDDYFGYYVDYIKEMVPSVLNSFMNDVNGPGNQYFDCTWNRDGVNTTTQICPFPDIELGEGSYKLYFTLVNGTGFYNDLETNYGIDASWVTFGEVDMSDGCTNTVELEEGCQLGTRTWYGFPQAASNIVVPNPKDVVTAAGANMTTLMDQIQETSVDLLLAQWDGSALDAAQVLAMPVALVQQAVTSMAQVKAIGKAEEEAQKKELILTIVTAVLAVVPLVGDASLAAAGLEDVARAVALIGETTNAAFDLYTIVSDPASAPMAILGMMLGSAALGRDSQSFAKMGKLRRDMSEDALSDMGEVFTEKNTLINTIVRSCTA
ncbi:unnamed protein product [Aspergillus niger]|nr:CAZyme family GH18 [Aspergillus niger]SPB48677.1 unnamed protein product [Aspergillus niger]